MTPVIAIDVALLPPADVAAVAVALSRALPSDEGQGLVLDDTHLPHVTLAQLFVATERLEAALDRIGEVALTQGSLRLGVAGGVRGANSVWMGIDRTAEVVALHERLMRALAPFEERHGSALAFFEHDARPRDVAWVTGYRHSSSFDQFTPHITLGHASTPPSIAPFAFDVTTLAVCHLGRFCTCRSILRSFQL